MGREIRMVPKGWEHPIDSDGYVPMFDRTYAAEAQKWKDCDTAYRARDLAKLKELDVYMGEDPEGTLAEFPRYRDWTGSPPRAEYYRPEFDAPADHFQMYETVSQGTPVSPVCASKGELAQWIVDNLGYSEDAAAGFVESGWAPSFVSCATGFHDGIPGVYEPGICGKETP